MDVSIERDLVRNWFCARTLTTEGTESTEETDGYTNPSPVIAVPP